MGNNNTKKSKKTKNSARQNRGGVLMVDDENDGGAMSQKQYDEAEVSKLKKELKQTPQIFVLNNLLMSVMFFESYERDKKTFITSSRTAMEKELNPALLRDETIECVIPDIIFESVNKNVRYKHLHGPNKNKNAPLVPRRLYVVSDNIEVIESNLTPQYSAIDKPSYQVLMEDSQNEGFVRLKYAPSQPRKIKPEEPVKTEPQPGPSSKPDDSEMYDYTTIADVNTPKPIDIEICERRDTLPDSCFTTKEIRKLDEDSDSSDEEEYEEEKPERKKLFETVSYVTSDGFMKFFQNVVFPNSLGLSLGFDSGEISSAKAIPGKIFCSIQDIERDLPLMPCEIIPSVAIQWPINLTYEFHHRDGRPTMWDKFGVGYRWPTRTMINDIRALSCVLIPRGYIPKRDKNLDSDIEWEVGFPKAQRYLDTHMVHSQVRAFLFLLTVYKTFIEPVSKGYDGLLVDHIRNHMYWECEENPRDWPEHRLGTKMILLLRHFIHQLSTGQLPDFFLTKKNMFANVPNKHLNHAQKVFHNILESPVLYFISALRNLKYTNTRFYPVLDFHRLYLILTRPSVMTMNGRIVDMIPPNFMKKRRVKADVEGDANYRKNVKWMQKQEQINRQRELERRQKREEVFKNERKVSVDSIDYAWECEKEFDTIKTREILIFFVKHFIEMARKSRKLATQRQALFYLKQSHYLACILRDLGLESDARELSDLITREEDSAKKQSLTESSDLPPFTPKRNSAQFNWENIDLTQQVLNSNINLNNLNKTYNTTLTAQPSFSKLNKKPSNLKAKQGVLRNSAGENADGGVRKSLGFSETIEIR